PAPVVGNPVDQPVAVGAELVGGHRSLASAVKSSPTVPPCVHPARHAPEDALGVGSEGVEDGLAPGFPLGFGLIRGLVSGTTTYDNLRKWPPFRTHFLRADPSHALVALSCLPCGACRLTMSAP